MRKLEKRGTFIVCPVFVILLAAGILCGCATVDDYWENGRFAVRDNDYDEAIAQYTKAVNASADDWELANSYKYRAGTFVAMGDYDKAIADYTEIINLGNKSGYLERGKIYFTLKNHDQALDDFTRYINIDNSDPLGFSYRGDVYFSIGKIDMAEDDYNKAMENYNNLMRAGPVIKWDVYNAWKAAVQNYITYFEKNPEMNGQSILVVEPTQFGNVAVSLFDNNFVYWSNCVIRVPSGTHRIDVKYDYTYTQTSVERGIAARSPSEMQEIYEKDKTQNPPNNVSFGPGLTTAQYERTTKYERSFTMRDIQSYFSAGNIYKIVFSDFDADGIPKKMDVKNITQEEGIQIK
jgi:tetratricopeptide (TPR) repeat protein